MKRIFTFAILLIITGFFTAESQWTEITSFPGGGTDGCASFEIDGKIYVAGGVGLSTLYVLNPANDTWQQKANIPGGVNRGWVIGFSIDGKGYVGGGDRTGSFDLVKDFYEYDPKNDSWTKIADYGGGPRDGAFACSFNGKGYVFGGFQGQYATYDVWEYDPSTDVWTQKSNYPGGQAIFPAGFVIDDKIYVGTGSASGMAGKKDFYEYTPATDTWKSIADFPGAARQACINFAVDGKGYVGGGEENYSSIYNNFYSFDPTTGKWTAESSLTLPNSSGPAWSTAAVVEGMVYFGTGANFNGGLNYTSGFFKRQFSISSSPKISLQTDALDFENVTVESTKELTFTIENTGNVELQVTEISTNNDVFKVLDSGPINIDPNETVDIVVEFTPAEDKEYTAELVIKSNAANSSTETISLSGTGVAGSNPEISINTESLLFGEIIIGSTQRLSIEIENSGTELLTVSEIVIENDEDAVFEKIAGDFSGELNPNEKIEIFIDFVPTEDKEYTANIVINSDAANSSIKTIPMSGTGVEGSSEILIDIEELSFGDVFIDQTKTIEFAINNIGNIDLEISKIEITHDTGSAFELEEQTFPATILVSDSLIVSMTFSPKEETSFSGNISIYSNDPSNPVITIVLSGEGKKDVGVNDFNLNSQLLTIDISPNPTVEINTVNLCYNSDLSKEVKYYITDISSKIVNSGRLFLTKGNNSISTFDLNLLSGCYFFVVELDGKKYQEKIIIRK